MAAAKKSNKRIRNRYLPQTPLEFVIWAMLFLLLAVLWFQDVGFVLRFFYSEYSVMLLFAMILEFLVLQSFDRSKIYKSERDQLTRVHQEELIIARKVESMLEEILDQTNPPGRQKKISVDELNQIQEKIQNALIILRSR